MAILLSTKPKWVAKICHEVGRTKDNIPIYEKRIEVRKGKPDILPCKVYLYCTKITGLSIVDYVELHRLTNGKIDEWSGKVIGEFVCDNVMFLTPLGLRGFEVHPEILKAMCLTKEDLDTYGELKTIYGWHIANLKIYDNPKELHEFYKPCVDKYEYCEYCEFGIKIIPPDEEEYALYHGGQYEYFNMICTNYVKRAPQSYMYVRELCE